MRATLRHSLARGWRQTRAVITDGVARLRERAAGTSPHALAAGGVRALGSALEVAAGPVASVAIAAATEVAVLAIATDAVRRAHRSDLDLRVVLDGVIVELARDRLCARHVAAGWRATCGTTETSTLPKALAAGIGRAAVRELTSRAATRALRKAGLKKLLWVGSVASLAQLPREVRRAVELIERAERAAAPAAESAPALGT